MNHDDDKVSILDVVQMLVFFALLISTVGCFVKFFVFDGARGDAGNIGGVLLFFGVFNVLIMYDRNS